MKYKPLTPLQQEKYDRRLEENADSLERDTEKLIDLGKIKAEEEEKRRREQEEAARYTEDTLEHSEYIPEQTQAELSEEEVAEQLRKAEPPKRKLGEYDEAWRGTSESVPGRKRRTGRDGTFGEKRMGRRVRRDDGDTHCRHRRSKKKKMQGKI